MIACSWACYKIGCNKIGCIGQDSFSKARLVGQVLFGTNQCLYKHCYYGARDSNGICRKLGAQKLGHAPNFAAPNFVVRNFVVQFDISNRDPNCAPNCLHPIFLALSRKNEQFYVIKNWVQTIGRTIGQSIGCNLTKIGCNIYFKGKNWVHQNWVHAPIFLHPIFDLDRFSMFVDNKL